MELSALLTVQDVAARLKLSASAIYQLVAERKISHRRIGGAIRFHEMDVREFLESSKQERKSAARAASKLSPHPRTTVRRKKTWF